MSRIIYLDGHYFNVNPQIIDAYAPGTFRAKGVFETMLGKEGYVMDPGLHLDRLKVGLKILGMDPHYINPAILKHVLVRNKLSLARVRLMVWQAEEKVHVMAVALPYKINKKKYRVCLIETNRPANDHMTNLKSLDYDLFARAYSLAQAKGFDEALLLNSQGHIFEASRANIFWMKDGVLHTPPLTSGCLNGITRQQVIKQAKSSKIPFIEENLTPDILKKASAAFLTNSLIGIKPIEIG